MNAIGNKIKNIRRMKGLTQEKLAEKIGRNTNLLAKWERGEVKMKAETIQEIASALQVPVAEFYNQNNQFSKNSSYQDTTEIQNDVPSMAYWGSLVDNAEKAAENGKNLDVILSLVNKAEQILQAATV